MRNDRGHITPCPSSRRFQRLKFKFEIVRHCTAGGEFARLIIIIIKKPLTPRFRIAHGFVKCVVCTHVYIIALRHSLVEKFFEKYFFFKLSTRPKKV